MTEPFSIEEAILHGDDCPKYTARDMRAYAAQAVAAERERCAKLVEEQESFGDPVQCWFDVLAAKIRKEPSHNPTGTSPV